MLFKFCVPDTFENIDRVRVLEWHCGETDHVSTGDLILELETHKVVIEVRAAQSGVLRRVLCAEGEWCALGAILAVLGDDETEALPHDLTALGDIGVDFQIA